MIIGIGHDLCDVDRIEALLNGASGRRFEERILAPAERKLAAELAGRRRAEFVAGRFAAKEAVSKALGCGIGGICGFRDISVLRSSAGRPVCELSPHTLQALGLQAQPLLHASITHERGLASAVAVLESAQLLLRPAF
ncbi:holo-ACP synthase [Paenibacillus humicus]|uniref:holo-ACP synthase n=1 Tax=Paenibacillus humicus TaxID=412861 RepID=UPI000FDA77D6|nr:holo-ACP synthase [Paenibacillus humicus]